MANHIAKLFLTYPQCPVPPVALQDQLLSIFPNNVERMCISQELHRDGNPHLHAYVQLIDRVHINKEKFAWFFDLDYGEEGTWHPNVQKARSERAVVRYVVKGLLGGAMQDLVEWPAPFSQGVLAKKGAKHDAVVALMQQGKRLQEVFLTEPGYVGFNLAKFQYLQTWMDSNQKTTLDPWPVLDVGQYPPNTCTSAVATWLATNILKPRPPRTPHLMMIGGTGKGKSYLIDTLRNYLRVYDCPVMGPYYAPWEDGKYDLIIMEELHAGWTASELLRFLAGSPITLKVHGGLNQKKQNVPIIITANQRFYQSYKNIATATLAALESRVLEVDVDSRLDVFPGIIPLVHRV